MENAHGMESFKDQQEFFKSHWPMLRQKLENGGAASAISWIDYSFSDPMERRVLFLFARQGMVMSEWQGRNLDACVQFADAAIAECLSQSARADEEDVRQRCLDSANMASYNLAADLAWCWADDFVREPRHFERGLKAAQECLKWRRQLGKGPWPMSMAWWADGVHRLALADNAGALGSFRKALDSAIIAAQEKNLPVILGPDCDGSVLMNIGWLALAGMKSGDAENKSAYDLVLINLASQEESPDELISGDAKVYRDQLLEAFKYLFPVPPAI
jgi:hypothetical protein